MTPFEAGHYAVLVALGLEKIALNIPSMATNAAKSMASSATSAGGLGRAAAGAAKTIAEEPPVGFWKGVGRNLWGQPVKAIKEVGSGKAFTSQGLFAEGMKAPNLLTKGLLYGLPAYMGYNIMKSDDPDKAQQLGGLAASTVVGNAMWGPLGMIGGALTMPIADRIGRGAVNLGQKVTGTFDSNSQNPYRGYQQQRQT
jgi:hypothetical protein